MKNFLIILFLLLPISSWGQSLDTIPRLNKTTYDIGDMAVVGDELTPELQKLIKYRMLTPGINSRTFGHVLVFPVGLQERYIQVVGFYLNQATSDFDIEIFQISVVSGNGPIPPPPNPDPPNPNPPTPDVWPDTEFDVGPQFAHLIKSSGAPTRDVATKIRSIAIDIGSMSITAPMAIEKFRLTLASFNEGQRLTPAWGVIREVFITRQKEKKIITMDQWRRSFLEIADWLEK